MNFMEAIKAMREGKKVRMDSWQDGGVYYHIGGAGRVIDNKGNAALFYDSYFEATDWQIVQKKTLSDEVTTRQEQSKMNDEEGTQTFLYYEMGVKQKFDDIKKEIKKTYEEGTALGLVTLIDGKIGKRLSK